jgi:hypothetical protein
MANGSDVHHDPLHGLRAEMFRHTRYPGIDALVAIVSKEQETSPEVKRTVDYAGEGRWYPVGGGWKVMCPYAGQNFDDNLFRIEKGGWSHVHCNGCQASIDTGASCWVCEREDDFLVLCDRCYEKLREAGDSRKNGHD